MEGMVEYEVVELSSDMEVFTTSSRKELEDLIDERISEKVPLEDIAYLDVIESLIGIL